MPWQKSYKKFISYGDEKRQEQKRQITDDEKHFPLHDGRWVLPDIREDPYPVRDGRQYSCGRIRGRHSGSAPFLLH